MISTLAHADTPTHRHTCTRTRPCACLPDCLQVPRTSVEFVIRAQGGAVSWEGVKETGGYASVRDKIRHYDESDPLITHHVVDRNNLPKTHSSRTYVQPQWVFGARMCACVCFAEMRRVFTCLADSLPLDCINEGILLPAHEYAPGVPTLPPHLSPFVQDDTEGMTCVHQWSVRCVHESHCV